MYYGDPVKTIAVIGWKNSGKTTVVSKLVTILKSKNLKVGVVKHAHHSFDIDKPNTDSFKIRQAGAIKSQSFPIEDLPLLRKKKILKFR